MYRLKLINLVDRTFLNQKIFTQRLNLLEINHTLPISKANSIHHQNVTLHSHEEKNKKFQNKYDRNKNVFRSEREQNIFQKNLNNNVQNKNIKIKNSQTKTTQNANISEQDYLVKIKDDPDNFGPSITSNFVDDDDLKEQSFLENPPVRSKQLRTKQYADIIKDLIRERKIKEAIDVLEIRMLKEDKVKPENYIYNLLLGACGRVGYTKKAFSLFNQMKKRGLKVHPGAYTALFNACANSPWPADGLSRAKHLQELMIEKRYEPNDTNYNAMIKAFGRCGDLQTAFSIVDEMAEKKILLSTGTLNFLLQACISDKDAGFRHALLVWRKYLEKRVTPDIYTFNLMLRCVRDCGLGNVEVAKDVLERLVGDNVDQSSGTKKNIANKLIKTHDIIENQETTKLTEKLETLKFKNEETIIENNIFGTNQTELIGTKESIFTGTQEHSEENNTRNLDNDFEWTSISSSKLTLLHNNGKLLISPGTKDYLEFLKNLSDKELHVNSKENKFVANCIQPTGENNLYSSTNEQVNSPVILENRPNLMGLTPYLGDILSLNNVTKPEDRMLLIGGMSGFLENMNNFNVSPDIKTFTQLLDNIPGALPLEKELLLAMKRYKVKADLDFYNMLIKKRSMRFDYEGSQEILEMMRKSNFRPNIVTYGVLALGCRTKEEAVALIEEMSEHGYRLNPEILGAMLNQAVHHMNLEYILEIVDICKNEDIQPNEMFINHLETFKRKCKKLAYDPNEKFGKSKSFKQGFEFLKVQLNRWKQDLDLNQKEEHPWQQFRQESGTDARHFKDKSIQFKPRRLSKFRKQQIPVEIVKRPPKAKKVNRRKQIE